MKVITGSQFLLIYYIRRRQEKGKYFIIEG